MQSDRAVICRFSFKSGITIRYYAQTHIIYMFPRLDTLSMCVCALYGDGERPLHAGSAQPQDFSFALLLSRLEWREKNK